MAPEGLTLIGATVMLLVGQTEPVVNAFPYADLLVQGGALVVLAWAVWHAYQKVIPSLKEELQRDRAANLEAQREARESFKETLDTLVERHERVMAAESERHDDWEKLRHEDSVQTRETLARLTETCAATRAHCERMHKDDS